MKFSNVFLDKTYTETDDLLRTSRDYLKWQAPLDVKKLTLQERNRITHEAMRVAIRLSQISAWLMVQKAVHTQAISREEALSKEYEVFRKLACLNTASERDPALPLRLRELLKESRLLYLRILRLDHTFRTQKPNSPHKDFLSNAPKAEGGRP